MDLVSRLGTASGNHLKIGKFHFQRHRSTANMRRFTIPPDLVDDGLQCLAHRIVSGQIFKEGVLGANGLPDPVGTHGALINAPRDRVIIGARFAEFAL